MQPAIAEARMFPRQCLQLLSKVAVVTLASIQATRSWNFHQPADVALAGLELHQQAPHFGPPYYELREFFRITDCNMSLSRLSSATSFFRRAFSSRRCFTSSASLTSMPPYRVLANTILSSHVLSRSPSFNLLQRRDHLRLCMLAPYHMSSPFLRPYRIHKWTNCRAQVRRCATPMASAMKVYVTCSPNIAAPSD